MYGEIVPMYGECVKKISFKLNGGTAVCEKTFNDVTTLSCFLRLANLLSIFCPSPQTTDVYGDNIQSKRANSYKVV